MCKNKDAQRNENKKKDGSLIKRGEIIAIIEGNLKNILIGERVALNFISHISGIATKTKKFVKKAGTKTKICCTRKTIPNLRVIQKYAVKLGGGTNHRFNLSDEYLIKDNHVASSNIKRLVSLAIKNKKGRKITVEVDNLKQLKQIIGLKFNTVLFDNMNIKNIILYYMTSLTDSLEKLRLWTEIDVKSPNTKNTILRKISADTKNPFQFDMDFYQ